MTQHNLNEIVDEKYRIDSVLGQGGMGTVYLAIAVSNGEKVALKILDRNQMFSEKNRRRFDNEGKAAYGLSHQNLVKVLDFGILPDGAPYFAMEYVNGVSLHDLLKEQPNLAVGDILAIFEQICDGLIYAHQNGVIHRDIKPSNIMISNSGKSGFGDNFNVKVVDFGIAKIMNEEFGEVQALTQTGEIFGSPLYMSPEQCKGGRIDARTDIYSLGCTLFEALTGTPPHVGTNALKTMILHTSEPAPSLKEATLGKNFSEDLEAVLSKMLKTEVVDRYQKVTQVKEDLQIVADAIADRPGIAGRKKGKPQLSANEHKKDSPPKSVVISAIAALCGATIFGGYLFFSGNLTPKQPIPQQQSDTKFDASFIGDVKTSLNDQASIPTTLAKAAKVTTEKVSVENKKMLQINFPNVSFGDLNCGDYRSPFFPEGNLIPAQGTVQIPLQARVQLLVGGNNQNCFSAPASLQKLPDDLISGFLVTRPIGFQLSDDAPISNQEFDKSLEVMLKGAATWTKLDSIAIRNLRLTDSSVTALNHMKNLKELHLWSTHESEKKLVTVPLLQRLKVFSLRGIDSDELVEAISHSDSLEELSLYRVNARMRTANSVALCKHLRRLHVGLANPVSADEFDAISRTKPLREVYFDECKFTPSDFESFLRKASHLKKIYLSGSSAIWAAEIMKKDHRVEKISSPISLGLKPFGQQDASN